MPTRLYLASTGSPAVTPSSWSAGWSKTSGVTGPFPCNTTKAASALTDASNTALAGAGAEFIAVSRWVSPALSAQTISGSITGVIRCLESNAGLNATIAIAAKVIKADGTDRGVLLAVSASDDTAAAPPEMGTSAATRRFQTSAEATSLTLSSVAATAGDFLVIEIGYREVNTNTARTATIRYGDSNASDFAHSDGLTTDLNPWVEFSGTINFSVDVTVTPSGVAGTGAIGSSTISAGATVTPSGLAATGAVGTVDVPLLVEVSGVAGTGAVGSPTVSASANTSPSGVAGAGAVGTSTVTAGSTTTPSGVGASGAAGIPTVSGAATVAPTGSAGTGSAGDVVVTAGSEEEPDPEPPPPPVQQASFGGESVFSFLPRPTRDRYAEITVQGVAASGAVGAVTVTTTQHVTVTVIGQAARGASGVVQPKIHVHAAPIGCIAAGGIGPFGVRAVQNLSDEEMLHLLDLI